MQKKLVASDSSEDSNNVIKGADAFVDSNGNGGVENDKKDKTAESLQPSKVAGVTE